MSYIETTRMVTAMHAFGPTDVRIRGMYFERTVQIVRLGIWNLIVKDYSITVLYRSAKLPCTVCYSSNASILGFQVAEMYVRKSSSLSMCMTLAAVAAVRS